MKFPITREQLQNIQKDVDEDSLQDTIELVITNIKEQIIAHAYSPRAQHLGGVSRTKLKVEPNKDGYIKHSNKYIQEHRSPLINVWKTHLDVIIYKLTELFPGVTFETDPLKTYILIDWT